MIAAALVGLTIQPSVLHFPGQPGIGNHKHVVLLAGDEEYRSEEMLPQLAKILSKRYGFETTVVFSQDGQGKIDPQNQTNQPGLEALDRADLCIMMLRFRHWPDKDMKHFVDYYSAGKPILAIRTSTHAFAYPTDSNSNYKDFSWNSKKWVGGFGKQVLGETWVSHWGNHGAQATRAHAVSSHPILQGVKDVFCTTDVYEANPPNDAQIIMRGEVVAGMSPSDEPSTGFKKTSSITEQLVNKPMMPIVWSRTPTNAANRTNNIITTTMGSATDFLNPGFRRLIINSVCWMTNVDVSRATNIDFVGKYEPTKFGFGGFRVGVTPSSLNRMD